jgi:hypothetical protein
MDNNRESSCPLDSRSGRRLCVIYGPKRSPPLPSERSGHWSTPAALYSRENSISERETAIGFQTPLELSETRVATAFTITRLLVPWDRQRQVLALEVVIVDGPVRLGFTAMACFVPAAASSLASSAVSVMSSGAVNSGPGAAGASASVAVKLETRDTLL